MKYLISVLILLVTPLIYSKEIYNQDSRIKYLQRSLASFFNTSDKFLSNMDNYITLLNNGSCAASTDSLKLSCLIESAKNSCYEFKKKKNREKCLLYSDIIITNKMSEEIFISRSERFKMMRTSSNLIEAERKKRNHIYSNILTAYYLSDSFDCYDGQDSICHAKQVDHFCSTWGINKGMAWHHCTASIVWFIGMNSRGS